MQLSEISAFSEPPFTHGSHTVTVNSLNQAEQLVLLTLRRYIEDQRCSAQVAMAYWFACGPGYLERILGGFEDVLGILPVGLRRDLNIAHSAIPDLTHDEWALLNLMAAIQHRDLELAEVLSRWLFVSSMENRIAPVIERLMTALSDCGLQFPPRHRNTTPGSFQPVPGPSIGLTGAPASAV